MNAIPKNMKNENIMDKNGDNQYFFSEDYEQLNEVFEENIEYINLRDFRDILPKCSKEYLKVIFEEFIHFYDEKSNYYFLLFNCFIEFIKDPNIILDKSETKESLLMFFCKKSNYKTILCLYKMKIELNVNYEDIMGRNSLFYLKGGKEDKNIIELLIKKNININHKDNEGNTALHNAIIHNANLELIYNLIDIGNANFMIKNNQNKCCLDLINLNYISKINFDVTNNTNFFIIREIYKLIKLIHKKLSKELISNISIKNNELNLSAQSENLFKIGSLSSNKNIIKESKNDLNNDIYLHFNKSTSLIIDMQKKFNVQKNNNLTLSQEIEYYQQINKTKKIFLNFLKNSENYLIERTKIFKYLLVEKKKELNEKNIELNFEEKMILEKNDELDNRITKTNLRINKINNNIKNVINIVNQKEFNITKMNYQLSCLNKYLYITKDKNKYYNYICNQLSIDLKDYYVYINERNKLLNKSINEIFLILQKIVKACLGKDYEARIYGSRRTGMCLPWSDIDIVIVSINNINKLFEPLEMLYHNLIKNAPFIESIKFISNTKVPIIKIKTKKEYNNLCLDISMETPSHHGQQCANYIIGKSYEYQSLVIMTLALKTIFYEAKLNDPYTGGLSSYGIILLIIYFLDNEKKKGNDISFNNVGKLFFELLLYYKETKNLNKPIVINESYMSNFFWSDQVNSFIIADPLNPSNNVANNVRQINKILHTFSISVKAIFENCECGCHYQHDYCLIEEKCNHNILNNIFNAIKLENLIEMMYNFD